MNHSVFYKQWKLALIDSNETKVDKLRSITESTVYHFCDTLLFINHLNTMTDARQYLILLVPAHLLSSLPADIEQKLCKLYIYSEQGDNEILSFDDVCLYLSNLILAQCTVQSLCFHRSKENAPARVFAQEGLLRSKNFTKQLQDLCDEIDERVSSGQEATS